MHPRVLVVEDDQDSRQLVQDRLLAMGYRVQFEVDGARVLEAVQTGRFEGLMLNVGVPFVDGLAVLLHIRRSDQHIPIVMVSTLGAQELAVRAIGMGAQAYVLKPFDIDELERVADYWFRPMEPLPSGSSEKSTRSG
jgi:DNA-binding response OmpR family regulator